MRQLCEEKKTEADSGIHVGRLHITSDWVMVVLTAALVLLTFGYVEVAYWQIRTSKNTERAWIVATDKDPLKNLQYQEESDGLLEMAYPHTFRNSGRTPARVTNIYLRFHTVAVKGSENEPDLPLEPEYKESVKQIPPDGRIVSPEENFTVIVRFEGSASRPALALSKKEFEDIKDSKIRLVSSGLVEYLDAFKKRRRLKFCRVYHYQRGFDNLPTGFYPGGPAKYHEAT
jgi:hypothetical protein